MVRPGSRQALWGSFENGTVGLGGVTAAHPYGLMSLRAKALAPSETRVLSIVLSWHYPERNYLDQRVPELGLKLDIDALLPAHTTRSQQASKRAAYPGIQRI